MYYQSSYKLCHQTYQLEKNIYSYLKYCPLTSWAFQSQCRLVTLEKIIIIWSRNSNLQISQTFLHRISSDSVSQSKGVGDLTHLKLELMLSALTTLPCCQHDNMLTLLLVGFSLKHILEKKIGTSLVEANSTPSASNQTMINKEPNPSTSVTDNEVYTAH